MNGMFVIAVVSLSLQFATTAALMVMGRASRWRYVRWFGAVTFTAGCYSVVDALAALRDIGATNTSWSLRFNLFFATAHGASWLIYTYMGRSGEWSSLPVWVQRASITSCVVTAVASITGVVASAEPVMLNVPSLGVSYPRNTLTPVGSALALVPFVFLALSTVRVWRLRSVGEQGTTAVFVGFVLFLLASVEELLVAAGALPFIFLGDLGYVCVVYPVAFVLIRRFRDDADQLDLLTEHLADEVQRRTDERDRAREQVIEQQRLAALGRMAAGVGHEINNPLQYLHFSLEELRTQAQAAENTELLRVVEQSFEGVERIRQVVEDLRTYVRPGSAALTRLDLRDVVRAALRVGAPQWREDITLDTQLDEVPLVQGHEGRLVQVVLNPLVNAVQAMRSTTSVGRSTLTIRTSTTTGGWARIEVCDEGPGFSDDVKTRLGEPYVTTRASDGGTGLGLFVSRGIVEAHGGTMHFENSSSGGALVRIELPPAAAPSVSLSTPPSGHATTPASTAAPLRVLLVEDDVDALRALLRGLQAEQITAIGYTNGRDAIEWLEHNAVDVVVTDLMMPGMSGWEFAAELAQRYPRLRERLVVLTGGASTPEAEAFARSGTVLVLDKPIGRRALAQALRDRVPAA